MTGISSTGIRVGGLIAIALLASIPTLAILADDAADPRAEFIRSSYTKFEHRIPMRDGKHLFTAVYTPNDRSKKVPILMTRTPYSVGPYGSDRYRQALGPTEAFEKKGYIFVFQDVRGRYLSEGEFVNMRPHQKNKRDQEIDESSDTYDTIDWLLENLEGHNGKVGLWGNSYPGFYSAAGMIDSHPALKAVSPQAPIADWFWDDMHHHGAFTLPLAFNFFSSFGRPRPEPTTERVEGYEHETPDGYRFFLEMGPLKTIEEEIFEGDVAFWTEMTRHPNYDEFWQSRNILPHLHHVDAAVLVVGGWFDTEDLYGPLKIYASVEEKNPRASNQLVMGPWSHGGWIRSPGKSLGPVGFGFETSEGFRKDVLLPFFEFHLRGGEAPDLPEAMIFETGANRWREFDEWPPKERQKRSLFLHDEGRLSFDPPEVSGAEAHEAYVSDPAKPVPYTMEITPWWAREYMTEDQRFAAWRPDVLVFESEVLEEDVTLAGPLRADLWVSTTQQDADWVVKLIDVFPGDVEDNRDRRRRSESDAVMGHYQMLVRGDVFRGRFRNSYEIPEPFTPDEVTRVAFEIQDVLHTFKRGHRIMIQVQSSWFPFVDRNPQKWVDNIFEADAEDFVPATHRVYFSKEHPSRLEVGVLE